MLREIFSMISPFRSHSRARQSAAFGGADELDAEEPQPRQLAENNEEQPGQASSLGDLNEAVDTEDRMIEDVEEGLSAAPDDSPSQRHERRRLDALASVRPAPQSTSEPSRASLPALSQALPLADSALVTPGLRRHFESSQTVPFSSTPVASTSYAAPAQTSPVSRNYDLLARFFAEKQRGGQGGLTEVEVEGCIRLIEESMATGRNLESEFTGASSDGRQYSTRQNGGFAPSSRASSVAAPALPASQSNNNLFHPGTSRMAASSSAYSFLAPRAPTSHSQLGTSASSARRRPIYLGPGMSGLSLHRRRPVVASASRAAALSRTQAQASMPRSSSDPSLARHTRDAYDVPDASDRASGLDDAKRRRINAATSAPSTAPDHATSDHAVQFRPEREKQARESSLLAKDISASSSAQGSGLSLKRAAPSAEPAAASVVKGSPPKVPTRTATAIQDILKTAQPVRPPTKPELINPYQSAAPRATAKSKEEVASTTPVRRSARTSMLTRAKARETAKAAQKNSPPKESVLELIERTAPKSFAGKRKATTDDSESQRNKAALATVSVQTPTPPAPEPSATEHKSQKTEEVQRRLEALTKAKTQQNKQQNAPNLEAADTPAKPNVALVPPQYTATKPKKPSPLSAAFQAPDSPSSDTEAATPAQRSQGPAPSQPSFSFGSPAASSGPTAKVPASVFSFSAPKPTTAAPASTTSLSGPSLAKPATSAPASAAPPSTTSSSTPVASAAMQQQKPAATTPVASTGFSFSTHAASPSSSVAPQSSSSTSAATSRSEVLAEEASKLPQFDWQVSEIPVMTNTSASKALRDEIKSIAQAALPEFDFIYEIETCPSNATSQPQNTPAAPSKPAATTSAPSAGFSFSAPASAPATPAESPAGSEAAETADDGSAVDPGTPQSSGLLGEGEGEESEQTLLEVRAKIWRFDIESKSWKDLGICVAKIKHDSTTNKHRLLARNEANGKVAVNFMAYNGLKSTLDKTVNSFLGFDGKEPTQYRAKVKTEDTAKEFKDMLEQAGAKA